MCGRDQKVHVHFPNFAQGLGFAGREAIFNAMEFPKTPPDEILPGLDTGVD